MLIRHIKKWWYIFAIWVCRMFCVVFFRMHVRGQENVPKEGAFLLISNHQSYLDPIFCGTPLRRQLAYVARDSLFKIWISRIIISSVGAIPIRRDKADLSAVKRMLAKLSEGLGLCLFPEATRTTDGKIAGLKAGFLLIFRKSKAPIVPVVIDGAFESWPKHKMFFSPGCRISVSYGKCIRPEDVAEMSDKQLAGHITKILRQMHNQSRRIQRKQPYQYQ